MIVHRVDLNLGNICSTVLHEMGRSGRSMRRPWGRCRGLGSIAGLVRSVTTPEFRGITFHEVLARSALNSVPGTSLPFNWTINPYRGCACLPRTASPGLRTAISSSTRKDFDQQIVVKTNVVDVLKRELARPSWAANRLLNNTDPYQRAESVPADAGDHRGVGGFGDAAVRADQGTLLRRDLELLVSASSEVSVGIGVSLALADEELRKLVEPGVPSVRGRLDLIRAVREAGLVWRDGRAGPPVAD